MDNQPERFAAALEDWQLIEAANATGDPIVIDLFERSLSPIENGAQAIKARERLRARLVPQAIANQIIKESQPAFPDIAPANSIVIGHEVQTGRPVRISLGVVNRHVLIVGASGAGKTCLIFWLIQQLQNHGIRITFSDHKGEGRRIPGAAVFRPDQEPWNMLEPIGHPETYWTAWAAEFGRAFGLRPETWTEIPELLNRLR